MTKKKRDYHAIIKIYDVNKMRIAERVQIYDNVGTSAWKSSAHCWNN